MPWSTGPASPVLDRRDLQHARLRNLPCSCLRSTPTAGGHSPLPRRARQILAIRVHPQRPEGSGVGSVGTWPWILLLLGRDGQDPLFLQAKEAQESVMERFVGKSTYSNHGQRVVAGQRLMQAASDIFLGWQRVPGLDGQVRDYYIRQLRDWKGSADVESMSTSLMTLYSRICGATLARAHARSGDRIAIATYLGTSDAFDRAIAAFAYAYADQNERDYEALVAAVRSGRLEAETGM